MRLHLPVLLAALSLIAIASNKADGQTLQVQWAHTLSGTGSVSVSEIVADDKQNIYTLGTFSGTVDFDPGSGSSNLTADTAFGKGEVFLAKYNVQGGLVFVRQYDFQQHKIALDPAGNIWLAGELIGTGDFDPGSGTEGLSSAGSSDIYLAKYDSTGGYINAFRIGAAGGENLGDVEIDDAGNAYITGSIQSATVDFDPGAGTTNITGTSNGRIFLAKYSNAGAMLYAVRLYSGTSSGLNEGVSLEHDAAGNIYLGGRFNGTINLDPAASIINLTAVGVDGFVAKYDPSGNFLYGYNTDGNVYDVQLDAAGNRWVLGTTPDSMDADPGPGRAMIYSVNFFDIYLARYDANGNFLHVKAFESNSVCTPESLAIDKRGSAYLCGRFPDTIDVNPGGSGGRLITNGSSDGFVVKYGASGNFEQGFAVGGTTGSDRVFGMAADQNGNVWMGGHISGTADIDPGTGTNNISSPTGLTAGFIVRYSDPLATGITPSPSAQQSPKIYTRQHAVVVDFTSLDQVDANISVYNTAGQQVAQTSHHRNDMLRLQLPDVATGLYLVRLSNKGQTNTARVWVE
jgi:hypothetical protein